MIVNSNLKPCDLPLRHIVNIISSDLLHDLILDTAKDFKSRKGMALAACNNLRNVWTSSIDDNIKVNTFKTIIEPILLYGSETGILSARQLKGLDGTYP